MIQFLRTTNWKRSELNGFPNGDGESDDEHARNCVLPISDESISRPLWQNILTAHSDCFSLNVLFSLPAVSSMAKYTKCRTNRKVPFHHVFQTVLSYSSLN